MNSIYLLIIVIGNNATIVHFDSAVECLQAEQAVQEKVVNTIDKPAAAKCFKRFYINT